VTVETTETVIFETVFTLEKLYRHPRPNIREAVEPLIGLPGIRLLHRDHISRAFELYTRSRLSFADCLHIALAEAWHAPEFVSFDRGIDRITHLRRVEP
jgi:predicted nucleic-acid-binding protein